MFKISSSGSFSKTEKYLKNRPNLLPILKKYADQGVTALATNTPLDSGETSDSWYYDIIQTSTGYRIDFLNRNMADEVPIPILIHYGHATKSGGWVEGIDFINPALRPIFDKLSQDLWKEATK